MKKIFLIIIILLSVINVKATNTIVMDLDSGRILYENKAHDKKLIASTTKIMTAIIAIEYGELLLDEEIEVGDEILSMYGTSIYLNYKEKMTLRDLLYGLIMRSGNDAAMTIANYIGGNVDNFVKLMNEKAEEIGMHNTIFQNPHGLDEKTQNYSTAYDMALLSCYAYKNTLYRKISGTKYYKTTTLNKAYSWINRNKLLFLYDNLTGGKTGYTPKAGKTFVSTASFDNLNLTIVSLDDSNHYNHHQILYDEYFKEYKNYVIIDKKEFNKNKKMYILNDIVYPLKKSEYDKVSYKINYKFTNPSIEIMLDNQVVSKYPIYFYNINKRNPKSLWERIKDFFK